MAERSHLDSFAPVTFRGATPPLNGWVCLSFDQEGRVIRIRLPVKDVDALGDALDVFFGKKTLVIRLPVGAGYGDACGVQPSSASGMPSAVGSPKLGQNVRPLASSCAAVCGSSYPPSEPPSKTTCQRLSFWMATQKVPCRVLWLYATALMALSLFVGYAVGGLCGGGAGACFASEEVAHG